MTARRDLGPYVMLDEPYRVTLQLEAGPAGGVVLSERKDVYAAVQNVTHRAATLRLLLVRVDGESKTRPVAVERIEEVDDE